VFARIGLLLAPALTVGFVFLGVACSSEEDPGAGGNTAPPAQDPVSAVTPWFEDVAKQVGVEFMHELGDEQRFWIPEITGSGLALFDMDNDGDLDLFVCQGGDLVDPNKNPRMDRLYRNDGKGNFEDVTEGSGIGQPLFSMGCAAGDYDGDGDLDLYVTNVGPNSLYRNDGDGKFKDVGAALGVDNDAWSTSCTFWDYDLDGDLDLYSCTYMRWRPEIEVPCPGPDGKQTYCAPVRYDAPANDQLYRNDGDGTFTDVSGPLGIEGGVGTSLGIVWGDLTGQGKIDMYIANDGMENLMWQRRSDGTFVDVAENNACQVNSRGAREAGMGVVLVDMDEDMHLDMFVTHVRGESNTLYRSRGARGGFRDGTARAKLQTPSMPFTGFGVGSVDFNHDGHLDLYVANGRVGFDNPVYDPGNPLAEPDQIFRGLGNGSFEELFLPAQQGAEATLRGGTIPEVSELGRGAAFGDIDNDGDFDVVVNCNHGALRILRNVAPKQGDWIMLDVLGEDGLPACGTRVELTAGDKTLLRQVQSTWSFCAANDPRIHAAFVGAKEVSSIEVKWLDGTVETFGPFPLNALHTVKRGTGH
jgi:enediyne biosynthesis protein E4